MRTVQEYITLIKSESRSWLDKMALDVYEFVYEIKQRWDELHELKRCEWEMLDNAKKQGDIVAQTKAALAILKTNDQILEMDMLLPQIAIPTPKPNNTSYCYQKQQPTTTRAILDEDDVIDGTGDDQP